MTPRMICRPLPPSRNNSPSGSVTGDGAVIRFTCSAFMGLPLSVHSRQQRIVAGRYQKRHGISRTTFIRVHDGIGGRLTYA